MNILMVCHYGMYQKLSSSFVHQQARAFAAEGHVVRVIIPIAIGKNDPAGQRFSAAVQLHEADGVELCYLRHWSLSRYGIGGFNIRQGIRAVKKHMDALLEGFLPDVIHAHTLGFDSEIGAVFKEQTGCPLVVTTHGSDTTVPMNRGEHAQMKAYCDKADTIVAVSDVLRNRLIPCGTTTPIVAIHNGFPLDHLAEEKERIPGSFMQVSNLIELKKVDVTIRAFAQIKKRWPEAELTIAGRGPLRKELEMLSEELQVSDSVHFVGFLPNQEVFKKLAQTQFYVMPSVREGLPISYLEAMASGCVTIGTATEGISEIIVHGENGFLVPPDDPDAIVRVIDRCLEDEGLMRRVAAAGRACALELTWGRNAQRMAQMFIDL